MQVIAINHAVAYQFRQREIISDSDLNTKQHAYYFQPLEKVRSKLKVSEKDKGLISPEKTNHFNKNNKTRKKNLLKNSKHVDHKNTNLGR